MVHTIQNDDLLVQEVQNQPWDSQSSTSFLQSAARVSLPSQRAKDALAFRALNPALTQVVSRTVKIMGVCWMWVMLEILSSCWNCCGFRAQPTPIPSWLWLLGCCRLPLCKPRKMRSKAAIGTSRAEILFHTFSIPNLIMVHGTVWSPRKMRFQQKKQAKNLWQIQCFKLLWSTNFEWS